MVGNDQVYSLLFGIDSFLERSDTVVYSNDKLYSFFFDVIDMLFFDPIAFFDSVRILDADVFVFQKSSNEFIHYIA